MTAWRPEPLTPFDEITAKLRMAISPLQTVFEQAEEELLATRPEGFNPEDIGRRAWELLPEAEREQAFAELLYTYWEATTDDRETRARYENTGGAA